ncbi:MAG: putative UDP-N-acetylmuramoylalanine--D-glutamate ligase [Candidatus Saccharibacteria bacterium]|nr:putative UDP-N-acetylmuramoylalanine--D-glutamate ligase [Candidatus Saccharibacteria bacterium]
MKIAIAGYGIEGQENFRYWSQWPENELTIVDEKCTGTDIPEGVASLVAPDAFSQLAGFDMVIRTAGLAPRKISTDGKIWSATNEFFEKCPAPIIGVTGSKGKGTTASLIASILEAAGKKVWLVGNIGVPALSVLSQIQAEDIVVYELSSFQLWDIERSPKTAVVLYIETEHLDVHSSMEEYVEAKAHITRFQSADDVLIYNASNLYSSQIAEQSSAQKVGFPSYEAAHVRDGWFYYGQQQLFPLDTVTIPGAHNIDNTLAAIDAVWAYTGDAEDIATGIADFKGLPHRLSLVRAVNGVEYYDDSIATTPTSAIAALRAFADKPKVLILGGSSKGSDFSELAQEITQHDVQVILIGDEAERIAEALQAAQFSNYEIIQDASAEAFTRRAAEIAQPGSVVLLSPAAASFGLFKNYVDRGEQFIAAVNAL